MKLSVIIPCFNAADTIGVQLDALARQKWSEWWEVVISDNGSTDQSLGIVQHFKERLPGLRTVDASDRRGAAHARNVGARAARGDSLAFCDADDEVGIDWVAAMGEALSAHDFVASRMDFEKLNVPWRAKHFRRHQSEGLQRLGYPPYLPHSGGCGLGVKRSLHEAVDGFDESLLRLMDTDYCIRLQLFGAELHFAPDAVVHVRCREKPGASFRQARLWGRYSVLLYKRYRPPGVSELWRWGLHTRAWKSLLRSLPRVWSPQDRAQWLFRLGWQIGMLQGSIEHRVPPVS
jgi:glycosyltransferase involved in cell wall biosynthesis